ALGIGLLGPLQVRDEAGRPVHVGGRQLRVLLTLLALNAGRVVPAGSLAGELWPDDPPGNPGNALQTLVSRLRAELRQGGIGDVIESHPAGYRLAVPPEAVDAMAFERLAGQGRHALAGGDAAGAARILREALLSWRGQPLADRLGVDPSAQLEQVYLGILRGSEGSGGSARAPVGVPDDSERVGAGARDRLPAIRMPSPLTSFVGRDEDIAHVLKNLRAAR